MPFPAKVFPKTQLIIAPKQKCIYISEQEFFYIFLHFFTKAGKSIFYNFLQFIYNCKKRPTLCVDSSPPPVTLFFLLFGERKRNSVFLTHEVATVRLCYPVSFPNSLQLKRNQAFIIF